VIQNILFDPNLLDNREAININYKPIEWGDFIASQIKHRIRLKFETPELKRENVDIDKEIVKIVSSVLKIYSFRDFSGVELSNILTQKKFTFNQSAIFSKFTE
ncbi:MAG: hypothetical protein N2Z79_02540, partial [Candidatus Omnitrophica bacterium]|nr:hypothetical protein [Candidatus Omnitrophota bacterium]